MTIVVPALRSATTPVTWAKNELWRKAVASPSLDLRFAETKSLVDATTGSNLVTFTRSTGGTYVGSDGLIKTAGVNEPRFDHDPVTGESLGLLVEESRANLLLQSEDFSTTWINGRSTISSNQIAAPDGSLTADKIVEDNSVNSTHLARQDVTVTANTVHTVSVYVKAAERSRVRVDFSDASTVADAVFGLFDLSAGTVSSSGASGNGSLTSTSIQNVGNGWYRCIVTGKFNNTDTDGRVFLYIDNGTSISYTGDNTSGIYAWGAQLEAGSFPTSYIPTTNATVTRAADVASISGSNFSSWYNQSEGTILAELRGFDSTRNGSILMLNSSTTLSDDLIDLYVSSGDAATSRVRSSGGVSAFLNSSPVLANINGGNKIAVGVQADNYALSLNGLIASSDTSGPIPTNLTIAYIGTANYTGVFPLCSSIKRITYWNRRLPDSTLQTITQ